MSWDNYALEGWHIDHIVPCAYFNLENPIHQYRCFNYINMRPMWGSENISKSDDLTEESIEMINILEYMFPDEPEYDSDDEEDYEEYRQVEYVDLLNSQVGTQEDTQEDTQEAYKNVSFKYKIPIFISHS